LNSSNDETKTQESNRSKFRILNDDILIFRWLLFNQFDTLKRNPQRKVVNQRWWNYMSSW